MFPHNRPITQCNLSFFLFNPCLQKLSHRHFADKTNPHAFFFIRRRQTKLFRQLTHLRLRVIAEWK